MVFDNVGGGPKKTGLLFARRLKMDFEQVEGMCTTGRTRGGQTSEIPFADSFTGLVARHIKEAAENKMILASEHYL